MRTRLAKTIRTFVFFLSIWRVGCRAGGADADAARQGAGGEAGDRQGYRRSGRQKSPEITRKEPYSSLREPYSTRKEPCSCVKEPYSIRKEPYSRVRELYSTRKSPTYRSPRACLRRKPPTKMPTRVGFGAAAACLRRRIGMVQGRRVLFWDRARAHLHGGARASSECHSLRITLRRHLSLLRCRVLAGIAALQMGAGGWGSRGCRGTPTAKIRRSLAISNSGTCLRWGVAAGSGGVHVVCWNSSKTGTIVVLEEEEEGEEELYLRSKSRERGKSFNEPR